MTSILDQVLRRGNKSPVHQELAKTMNEIIAQVGGDQGGEHELVMAPDCVQVKFGAREHGKAFLDALSSCWVHYEPHEPPIMPGEIRELTGEGHYGADGGRILVHFDPNGGASRITAKLQQHLAGWGTSAGYHINGDVAAFDQVDHDAVRGQVFLMSAAESLSDPKSFRIELEHRVKPKGAVSNAIDEYVSSEKATLTFADGEWTASDNLATLMLPIEGVWRDFVEGVKAGHAGVAQEGQIYKADAMFQGVAAGESIAQRQAALKTSQTDRLAARAQEGSTDRSR